MATFLVLPSPSCGSLLGKGTNRFYSHTHKSHVRGFRVRALKEKTEEIKSPSQSSSAEEVTKKYGLEAGLWKVPISFSHLFWVNLEYLLVKTFKFSKLKGLCFCDCVYLLANYPFYFLA